MIILQAARECVLMIRPLERVHFRSMSPRVILSASEVMYVRGVPYFISI